MELVEVRNVTRGDVLAERVRIARSLRDRTVGLLRTPEVRPGEGLWIEGAPSIHMFFMPYAIDAVFVARDGRVTKIVEGLRPWRVVLWARGARDCLELRAGTVDERGLSVGDILELGPEATP